MAHAIFPAKIVAITPIGEKLLKNVTRSGNIPRLTLIPVVRKFGIFPNAKNLFEILGCIKSIEIAAA